MSPDDSCSLIIGTDQLEGRKIKIAKSGDRDRKGGFPECEVKKGKILAGRVEPKGSTASPTKNMKIALGVCTAIGLLIFGVAR